MSKKQGMKEIFEEKVNKDKIYQNVLLKVEEECNMNKGKNKKLIYCITSSVAVVILGFGIIVGTNTLNNNKIQNNPHGIADTQDINENKEELNIYKVASLISSDMDVKIEHYNPKLPKDIWQEILEEFKEYMGISKNEFETKIPDKFIETNFYTVKVPGYKDANLSDEYKKHDYVFEYKAENDGEVRIALCKEEEPLRDYFFEFKGKKSKIGNTELEISQYKNDYLVTFKFDNINYDIETKGISEYELVELLNSIIKK